MRERASYSEEAVWCLDMGQGQGEWKHGVFSKDKENEQSDGDCG